VVLSSRWLLMTRVRNYGLKQVRSFGGVCARLHSFSAGWWGKVLGASFAVDMGMEYIYCCSLGFGSCEDYYECEECIDIISRFFYRFVPWKSHRSKKLLPQSAMKCHP
jgi:hypothetical protein